MLQTQSVSQGSRRKGLRKGLRNPFAKAFASTSQAVAKAFARTDVRYSLPSQRPSQALRKPLRASMWAAPSHPLGDVHRAGDEGWMMGGGRAIKDVAYRPMRSDGPFA